MTDDKIIKALECCMKSERREDCKKLHCPAYEIHGCYFNNILEGSYPEALIEGLSPFILDLLNRQRTEIERLRAMIEPNKINHDSLCETETYEVK